MKRPSEWPESFQIGVTLALLLALSYLLKVENVKDFIRAVIETAHLSKKEMH